MRKGFTLIELLIVIGILAILATTVVLVLNPAQILAESRDTQRIADLKSVISAIALAGAATPPAAGFTSTAAQCTYSGTGSGSCSPFVGGTCLAAANTGTCAINNARTVGGAGWVQYNFGTAPTTITSLPLDPLNTTCVFGTPVTGNCYASKAEATGPFAGYELNARLESTKHIPLMTNDGGNTNDFYEVGTKLTL